ncbi:CDK5 regulatory subunit-associated protein 3 [Balamuthia mandrillaris]
MLQDLISSMKTVGEGRDGEMNIPIDIHYHKLLEWLLDRHKIRPNWRKELKDVHTKLNKASEHLPEDARIQGILSSIPKTGSLSLFRYLSFSISLCLFCPVPYVRFGSDDEVPLNYFACVKIFEVLRELEPENKNMFGQYTSKLLKEWHDLLKAYEHNLLYLGEASQLLISNVKYELPSLKKKLDRSQKQMEELERKEVEYNKGALENRKKYEQECADIGIEGKNVREELQQLVSELPNLLAEVVATIQRDDRMAQACNLYKAFAEYTFNFAGQGRSNTGVEVCPTLTYVLEHGNAAASALLPASEIQSITSSASGSSAEAVPTAIDWGEGEQINNETAPLEIDWGGIVAQFDVVEASEGDKEKETEEEHKPMGEGLTVDFPAANGSSSNPIEINWDISIESEGSVEPTPDSNLPLEDHVPSSSSQQETASRQETILENTKLRLSFLDDLHELRAFLQQRLAEGKGGGDFNTMNEIAMSAPAAIRQHDEFSLSGLLKKVDEIMDGMNRSRLRHIIDIKNSKRYADRLASSIGQNMILANTLAASAVDLQRKKQELQDSISQTYPRIAAVSALIASLKKEVEASLSKLYSGRTVRLIGDISNF